VATTILIADDDDAVANLIERHWFAASSAVSGLRDECDLLREVTTSAAAAWRQARAELRELEALRDTLDRQLNEFEGKVARLPSVIEGRAERSAA
jgi:chromosome segregation ATPase